MTKKNKSKTIATTIIIIGLAITAVPSCKSKAKTEKAPADTNEQQQTRKETIQQTQKETVKKQPVPNTQIRLTTNLGDIVIELDTEKAPLTTANFLKYVEQGHYDGTIFHRVIPNFMIQGGGFRPNMRKKVVNPPIRNEASNGLKNLTGTVAMARTNYPHSATCQFFINLTDNPSLDYTPTKPGYAVFGKVIEGMETVNKISAVKTGAVDTGLGTSLKDVPIEPVIIQSAKLVE
jgi:peptidyl-prolyl cis-trans isomerase B (cyclophilin B)